MAARYPVVAAAAHLPLHPHDPSFRCLVKNSPIAAQTRARPLPKQPMSILMSSVGLLSQKSTMLPSGTLPHHLLSFLKKKILILSSRWFHIRVCLVAGVGFFTDAYVVPNQTRVSPPSHLLIATIFSLSTSPPPCWVMSMAQVNSQNPLHLLSSPLTVRAGGKLSAHQDLGVKVATPVGTLCGQLLFGWLADVVGRKRMCKS
jgi:hypothetical protein